MFGSALTRRRRAGAVVTTTWVTPHRVFGVRRLADEANPTAAPYDLRMPPRGSTGTP